MKDEEDDQEGYLNAPFVLFEPGASLANESPSLLCSLSFSAEAIHRPYATHQSLYYLIAKFPTPRCPHVA